MGFGTFTEILLYVSYFVRGLDGCGGSAQASRMPEGFNWCQPDNFYHLDSSICAFLLPFGTRSS